MIRSPQRLGAALGLAAAALFGLSAPLSKLLLEQVSVQLLAGLLYLGGAFGLIAYRLVRRGSTEAPLRSADLPALGGVVLLGGIVGPLLMLFGLQRVTAATGSLLLNLEAPFTMLLAVLVFREHLGRYGAAAAALIVLGAVLLKMRPGNAGADTIGVLAIAGACLCWAVDNNLTQRLSSKDPFTIARYKTLVAGTFNVVLAMALGAGLPRATILIWAVVVGSLSYGVSIVLDSYALRLIGAARESAYFATAPFVGAVAALVLLGERPAAVDALGMLAMAAGVVLMIRERHSHWHRHEAMEHEHAHIHDDHHRHDHGPGIPPGEPHSHLHRHEEQEHEHPHVPDVHHRHKH